MYGTFYETIDVVVPAGGAVISVSDTTNSFGLYWSNGTPEGSVSGPVGSICSDYANGNIYKKSSGAGNTGWTILAAGSGTTNLGLGTNTSTTLIVTSSTGTGVTLPSATSSLAGLLPAADKVKLNHIAVTQAVDLDAIEADGTALVTLSGVASGSTHLGTFTGSTVADNSSIKSAIQSLETLAETKLGSALLSSRIFVGNGSNQAAAVAASGDVSLTNTGVFTVVTASATVAGKVELATEAEVLAGTDTARAATPKGVSDYIKALVGNATGVANLGTLSGSTVPDGSTVKGAIQALETKVESMASGLTPAGTWDATTASPVGGMANSSFKYVSVAGTTSIVTANFGTVSEWAIGDILMKASDGSIHKIDNTDSPVNLGIASVSHSTLNVTSSTGTAATIPAAVASSSQSSGSGSAGLMSGDDKFKVANTGGYAATYGGSTSNVITHNLGTKDVQVQVYRLSDGVQVFPGIVRTSINSVTLTHSIAPAASSFRAVISRVSV